MTKIQLEQLAAAFLANTTVAEMVLFLQGILTPKELAELTMRLKIVKLLKKGTPQRLIAEELGVGIATVTRGSKEIQLGRFAHV